MKVLIDTCIWSIALRKSISVNNPYVLELGKLIEEARVQLIGPIRQEILSGVKVKSKFRFLKNYLSAFPDLNIETGDYECAAEFYNVNRQKGIQGSSIDFLICAVSYRYDMPIFTTDKDFDLFRKYIPITLYVPDIVK